MTRAYFVWDLMWAGSEGGAVLDALQNVEFKTRLLDGVQFGDTFPSDAAFYMRADLKDRTMLTDTLINPDFLVVASKRLVEFLRARDLKEVEYLPVTIFNHAGQAIPESYFIVHAINHTTCLNEDASGAMFLTEPAPGALYSVEEIALDSNVDSEREVLRPKPLNVITLVGSELCDAIDEAGFTGSTWLDLEESMFGYMDDLGASDLDQIVTWFEERKRDPHAIQVVEKPAVASTRDLSVWDTMETAMSSAIDSADLSGKKMSEVMAQYDLDGSAAGLKGTFEYVVEIDRVTAAKPLPIGTNKIGGKAHLPPDFEWPQSSGKEPYFLYAQLNLETLKPFDIYDALPERGFLYYFITERADGVLRYVDCSSDSLVVDSRHSPEAEVELRFRRNFYFDQGSDIYNVPTLIEALPNDLRQKLSTIVGGKQGDTADCMAGDRLFGGLAMDWQAMGDILRLPLLMQFEAFDGNLLVGVDFDKLRAGDVADARCKYSGT